MTTRRDALVVFGAGISSMPFGTHAQPARGTPRLGFLHPAKFEASAVYTALIPGLAERGYVNGKNIVYIATKDTLVIGEGAKVNAEIQAGTVIVNGQVEGNIKASVMVELHPPARVKGSIETPALSIDKGVIFEGTCKMESSPNGASKAPPSLGAPAVAK